MEMFNRMNWSFVVVLCAFAAVIPAVAAEIHDIDSSDIYWVSRKAEAMEYAMKAYNPTPEHVTRNLTAHVKR